MLMEDSATTSRVLELSKQIERAKIIRGYGSERRNRCIEILNSVISDGKVLLNTTNLSKGDRGLLCSSLADAYCLRALCKQEETPGQPKLVFDDIKEAVKKWLELVKTHKVSPKNLTLLYHALDLLSLKGYMDCHLNIFTIMIQFFTINKISKEKCLKLLWNTKSLNHALCASPIGGPVFDEFTKHMESLPKEVRGRLKAEFLESLSVMATFSTPSTQVTTDDIKDAVLGLNKSDPECSKSRFSIAHIYYDLSEKLTKRGSMVEALVYARKAEGKRAELFSEYFTIKGHIRSSMATSAWQRYDGDSCDIEDHILTPWNVLRFYLESKLQVGTLQEIIGNSYEANQTLSHGNDIAILQSLPIFIVRFTCVLAKLSRKNKNWDSAFSELRSALQSLVNSDDTISCKKCRLILEAKIYQQYGDLSRSSHITTDGSDHLSKALKDYEKGKDRLEDRIWSNRVSVGKDNTASNITRLCDAFSTSSYEHRGKRVKEVACDEVNCWHCLLSKVTKSSLQNVIDMKWECIRRRILLRLLNGIGKCHKKSDQGVEELGILLKSMCLLFTRKRLPLTQSSIKPPVLAQIIERNVVADIFAVEQASIIYNLCWLSLKTFRNKRHNCEHMYPLRAVMPGLKLSFILCHDVPSLFQKVSWLIAVLYTVSPSNVFVSGVPPIDQVMIGDKMTQNDSTVPSSSDVLSKSLCAWYFHQASLGTHRNFQIRIDDDGSGLPSSTSLSLPRLAPKSVMDLKTSILKFSRSLPSVTIVCISMFSDDFGNLLRNILPCNHPLDAWIMLSRMNSDGVPVVVVLPIETILADSSSSFLFFEKSAVRSHQLFWDNNIIDKVAPMFKEIIEESTKEAEDDTEETKLEWKTKRRSLDKSLHGLISNVQNKWFGPWTCLLLGDTQNCEALDSILAILKKDLQSKCKKDVHESILKLAIGGDSKRVECVSKLIVKNGCHVGEIESSSEQKKGENAVSKLIRVAMKKINKNEDCKGQREPTILVLDLNIQLKYQEVYRMPSVTGILYTFDRCHQYREKVETQYAGFPMIDPLDGHYMLNPGGNLMAAQNILETSLKKIFLEGKTGTSPSEEEVHEALQKHELFMYFGHGDGERYIPPNMIQKLDRCAAVFLIGCSSGFIYFKDHYRPEGAPLNFLNVGSPLIVANLWTVTAGLFHFGKSLVAQCTKNRPKKKNDGSREHKPRIGSFMGLARDRCF